MRAPLTPVELRAGRWYKREDLHRHPSGVNGGKYRACEFLLGTARTGGARHVVSAASVLSPQSAMAGVLARQFGMDCTIILGGSNQESAPRHPSVRIAVEHGAKIEHVPVGYNPYLQAAAGRRAAQIEGAYWLRYGITPPPDASPDDLLDFHNVGADQASNLPPDLETLVVPFGSGNSAAGVIVGLDRRRPPALKRLVLVGIGPDRRRWLDQRLEAIGVRVPVAVEHIDLHGTGWVRYGDRMPGEADGITLHPTYEGKVVRYLDQAQPEWWRRRDGTTCLWIVGGELVPDRAVVA